MNYFIKLLLAILLTSLACLLGDLVTADQLFLWQPFVIGGTVVIAGALVEKVNAPMWLIIAVPFPIGMVLLYLFINDTILTWFMTYAATLLIYIVIHIIASALFRFHSLIPAWKIGKG